MRLFLLSLVVAGALSLFQSPGRAAAAAPGCYDFSSVAGETQPGTARQLVEWPSAWPRSNARPNGALSTHYIWLLNNAAEGGTFRMVSGGAAITYFISGTSSIFQVTLTSTATNAPPGTTHLAVTSSGAAFVVEFCPAAGSALAPTPTATPTVTPSPTVQASPTPSATAVPAPCASYSGALHPSASPAYYVAELPFDLYGSTVRVVAPGGWLNLYGQSSPGSYFTIGDTVNVRYPVSIHSQSVLAEAEQPFTLEVWNCGFLTTPTPTPTPIHTVTTVPTVTASPSATVLPSASAAPPVEISALSTEVALLRGDMYTMTLEAPAVNQYLGGGIQIIGSLLGGILVVGMVGLYRGR